MTAKGCKVINHKDSQQKVCTKCGVILDFTNCASYCLKYSKYTCDACAKIISQKKYIDNKEHMLATGRARDWKIKTEMIAEYGGKCACCGETHAEFLCIDHIANNGAAEREQTKQGTGTKFYRWLKKKGFPKSNYRLLCHNCNCAFGFFGYCPHNKPDVIVPVKKRAKIKLSE